MVGFQEVVEIGEFTGLGDVWGEGRGKICFARWQKVV
jgi:hypothetical protein